MTHTHHRKLHAARARAFAHAATTALPTYPVPPQQSAGAVDPEAEEEEHLQTGVAVDGRGRRFLGGGHRHRPRGHGGLRLQHQEPAARLSCDTGQPDRHQNYRAVGLSCF